MADLSDRFLASFAGLAAIGRNRSGGGYRRLTWGDADREARAWFRAQSKRIGLVHEVDRNGNLWAWWGDHGSDAVVSGSHLDTVVNGGAFDGALGVVAAFSAIEELQASGRNPKRPLAVVAFIEEEGARFGVPTLGSRLMSGAVDPDRVRSLVDRDGISFSAAMQGAGLDPDGLGGDTERLARLGCFIELHIEQGRGLVDVGAPVGVISGVWPHGRWRLTLTGSADHAGTTLMEDRKDPVVVAARAVAHARRLADAGGVRATIGRVEASPNTTNTIAGSATVWLDVRGSDQERVLLLVDEWTRAVEVDSAAHGVAVSCSEESRSEGVSFDEALNKSLAQAIEATGVEATAMPTAAGHDAAILAEHLPTAMIHVRNPTGTSHSPAEHAETTDCVHGVAVLAEVLGALACK